MLWSSHITCETDVQYALVLVPPPCVFPAYLAATAYFHGEDKATRKTRRKRQELAKGGSLSCSH